MEKKNILKIGIYDSEVLARELREGMKDKLNPDIQIRYTSDDGEAIVRRVEQGDFEDIYMISEGAFPFNSNGNPQQVILANYIRMVAGGKPLIVAYDNLPEVCADPHNTRNYRPFEAGIIKPASRFDEEQFYQDMTNLLNTSDLKQIVESKDLERLEEIATNSPIFRLFRNLREGKNGD